MKPKIIRLSLLVASLSGVLLQCKPEVEKPAIENCLISKIDALDVNPVLVNGNPVGISVVGVATLFEYDKNNQPIKFSYYSNSALTGYTTVTYNSDGTLDKGQNYDNQDFKTGRDEYFYDSDKKLDETDTYDDQDNFVGVTLFEYGTNGLFSLTTEIQYDPTYDEFSGRIFRYEYDAKNNLSKRYSRYLFRPYDAADPNFYDNFVTDLGNANEVLNITMADYDDQFNPYRSQPNLAALFDYLPGYNNARTVTYHYVDSGDKYADLKYSYEYNRKGFPYIYNVAVNYTTQYTNDTGLQDYTETSSYEYLCK